MAFTLQSGGVAARGAAKPSASLAARRGSFASAAPLRAACRAARAALPARGAAVRVRAEGGACATRPQPHAPQLPACTRHQKRSCRGLCGAAKPRL
jgi:hypothetical protein